MNLYFSDNIKIATLKIAVEDDLFFIDFHSSIVFSFKGQVLVLEVVVGAGGKDCFIDEFSELTKVRESKYGYFVLSESWNGFFSRLIIAMHGEISGICAWESWWFFLVFLFCLLDMCKRHFSFLCCFEIDDFFMESYFLCFSIGRWIYLRIFWDCAWDGFRSVEGGDGFELIVELFKALPLLVIILHINNM